MDWVTTTQVLEDLSSGGESAAWKKFNEHFYGVVVRFARHAGLSAADAEDAAQETMLTFVKAFRGGKYHREKGRLRDWLFGVAKRVIFNLRRQRPQEQLVADASTGTSFWDMVKDDKAIEQSWQDEWRKMTLAICLEQARREMDAAVFAAFELYAMQEQPVEEVAKQLATSRNAVYIAKSRVLARLRELEKEFE
jgi:RNA polymerase sigma factor (sigma-70 family)